MRVNRKTRFRRRGPEIEGCGRNECKNMKDKKTTHYLNVISASNTAFCMKILFESPICMMNAIAESNYDTNMSTESKYVGRKK